MNNSGGLRIAICPVSRGPQLHSIAAEGLPSVCILAGISLSVCNWFGSVNAPWWGLLSGMVLLYVLLQLLQATRIGKWAPLMLLALTMTVCVVFNRQVLSGVATLGNDFMAALGTWNGKIYLDMVVTYENAALWGVVPMLILVVALLHWSIRGGNVLFILPVLLCSYAGVLTGIFPIDAGFIVTCMGTILLFMRTAVAKSQMQSYAGVPTWMAIVAVCTAIAIGVGCWIGPSEGKLAQWDKAMHRVFFDDESNAMPEGDLHNLSFFHKNSTPALKITMTAPQKMYLRGQIVEVYSADAWCPLTAQQMAEHSDLFYWLHRSGFYGQSQIGQATSIVTMGQLETITVERLSACGAHGYYPYSVFGNAAMPGDRIGDTALPKTSTLQYYPGSVPQWYETQHALTDIQDQADAAAYLAAAEAYEAYLKEVDLQLTDESFSVLKRQLEGQDLPNTLSQIRTFIREYLAENLVYDERVKTMNEDGDFLQYVLERSGSGYNVHYATAATLMLRYLGVPARYVEGYFLSAEEAALYQAGEEIILTEKHAHAWAEYYLPGVGFVPFEVTPGYMDDEELQLGGGMDQQEPIYDQEHLEYAQVEQPERIEDPRQDRISFSVKAKYLLFLLVLPIALIVLLIYRKRKQLKRAFSAMNAAQNREAIALRYGYAKRLMGTVQNPYVEGIEQAALLNQEALFSDHDMTDLQRQEMDAFAQRVLCECKQQWTIWKKLRYWLWECLY